MPSATTPTEAPPKPPSPSDIATAQQTRFIAARDAIRTRSDLTAKALAGLGSTALTGIGLSKIGDVYPRQPGWAWWESVGALVGSFGLMAAAIGAFTYRLWRTNEPIVMRSDLKLMEAELDTEELELVAGAFNEMARLNDVQSLAAYEARGHRLSRIARRTADPAVASERRERAGEIAVEVEATQALGILIVVRRRVARAITARWAIVFYAMFVTGIVGFAISSDRLASEKGDKVGLAQKCADARKAGATRAELPNACSYPANAPEKLSTEELNAKNASLLVQQVETCVADATASELKPSLCDGLRAAATAALAGT